MNNGVKSNFVFEDGGGNRIQQRKWPNFEK